MEQGFDWEDEELFSSKLIYTYRKPEYIYQGWKDRWMREHRKLRDFYKIEAPKILKELENSKGLWEIEQARGNHDIYLLRLEDLRGPGYTDTLTNLCSWLGIGWSDSLLHMTISGNKPMPGFHLDASRNNGHINSKEHDISGLRDFERKAIEEVGLYL
jgi:hypothetical protein